MYGSTRASGWDSPGLLTRELGKPFQTYNMLGEWFVDTDEIERLSRPTWTRP
jgi:hypothetical protein